MSTTVRIIAITLSLVFLAGTFYIVYANGLPALSAALAPRYGQGTPMPLTPVAVAATALPGDGSSDPMPGTIPTTNPFITTRTPGGPLDPAPGDVGRPGPSGPVFVEDGCDPAAYPPLSATLLRDFDAANGNFSFADDLRIPLRITGELRSVTSTIQLLLNGEMNLREAGQFALSTAGSGINNGVSNSLEYEVRLVDDLVFLRASATTGTDTGWLGGTYADFIGGSLDEVAGGPVPARLADDLYAQINDLGFENYRYTTLTSAEPGRFVVTTCIDLFGFLLSAPVNDLFRIIFEDIGLAPTAFNETMLFLRAAVPSLKVEAVHTIEGDRVRQLVLTIEGQASSVLLGGMDNPRFNLRAQFDVNEGLSDPILPPEDYTLVPDIGALVAGGFLDVDALETVIITATP